MTSASVPVMRAFGGNLKKKKNSGLISTKRTEHVSLCSPVTVDSNIPHSRNGGTLLLAKLGC